MCARAAEDCLNGCLPPTYAPSLGSEAEEMLRRAINGLRGAVHAGDLQRGVRFHAAALKRYLNYKHKLPDEARTECIYLLYPVVTSDADIPLPLRVREVRSDSDWESSDDVRVSDCATARPGRRPLAAPSYLCAVPGAVRLCAVVQSYWYSTQISVGVAP